jgi:glucosyl-3-phosphoglycerate synthase
MELSTVETLGPPASALRASVVVPARNEEDLLPACIAALAGQRGVAAAEYEVIVVLDACTDASAEAVERARADYPELRLWTADGPGQGSGAARATGMDIACSRLESLGRGDGLIASTDADSMVAADWLARQLEALEKGARAIGGEVRLDPATSAHLPEPLLRRREAELGQRKSLAGSRGPAEHPHFSGASLGITAEAYRDVGGMGWVAALEDQDLEDRLAAASIPIHRLSEVQVTTSARLDGRAGRGLAKDLAVGDWLESRCFSGRDYSVEALLESKNASVGVVLPAREVASTIGHIVDSLQPLREVGLIDQLLVVDADSRDGTASIAAEHGAEVVPESALSPELGPCLGKGDAMWRAARAVDQELLVFLDADTAGFTPDFMTGLLGPAFSAGARLVKGAFRRPFSVNGSVRPDEGGRVTELVARPLINLWFPELAGFAQPLAGEQVIERSLFRQLSVPVGYGVEIAMLIDCLRLAGLDSIAQVDLGTRQNRHQPLAALSAMALQLIAAAERRHEGQPSSSRIRLMRPTPQGEAHSEQVACQERPPW